MNQLQDLEAVLKKSAIQQPIKTPEASEVLAVRGDLPTETVEITEGALRRMDLKFSFTNPAHVPKGIFYRSRDRRLKPGEHSAKMAHDLGKPDLARFERHRKGAFDTGLPVVKDLKKVQVAMLRRGLRNINLLLLGCFYYVQQKPGQMKKWTVVLRFGWEQVTSPQNEAIQACIRKAGALKENNAAVDEYEKNPTRGNWEKYQEAHKRFEDAEQAELEAVHVLQKCYKPQSLELTDMATEMLRALARTTWGIAHVWKNPDRTVTVNLLHRSPDVEPEFAIAVRDHKLAVLDVRKSVEESEE